MTAANGPLVADNDPLILPVAYSQGFAQIRLTIASTVAANDAVAAPVTSNVEPEPNFAE